MTMLCHCGKPFTFLSRTKDSLAARSMNETRRLRKCPDGHATATVEMAREELVRIRRLAHLQVMSEMRR